MARFINADKIIWNYDIFASNLLCYCLNAPCTYSDETGYGVNVELWGGSYYRIDPANPGAGEKRHIHIFEDGKEYSQNSDGSPHKGSTGSPSKSIKKYLKKNGEWDWDGNRAEYIENLSAKLEIAQSVQRVFGDTGWGIRVIIDGIAEFYSNEDFIEAGGRIVGEQPYLPNSSVFYLPIFSLTWLNTVSIPFLIPSIAPLPVFIF